MATKVTAETMNQVTDITAVKLLMVVSYFTTEGKNTGI